MPPPPTTNTEDQGADDYTAQVLSRHLPVYQRYRRDVGAEGASSSSSSSTPVASRETSGNDSSNNTARARQLSIHSASWLRAGAQERRDITASNAERDLHSRTTSAHAPNLTRSSTQRSTPTTTHFTPPAMDTSGPTVILPKSWKVPTYLEQSAFYDRFTVGQQSAPPSSSSSSAATPYASSSSNSVNRPTIITPSPSMHSLDANGKGKERAHDTGLEPSKQPKIQSPIPLPSRLDPEECCKRLLISKDYGLLFLPERDEHGREKLNRHDPDKDAAAVRADFPIPPQTGIYYFEVEIISRGQKGYIGIGFSTANVSLERLPGWNAESYGYHGDDGKAFSCSGTGSNYGPKFGSGDIIGCGIDFLNKKAFFVKNGKWLGYVFDLAAALNPNASSAGGENSTSDRDKNNDKTRKDSTKFYPTIGLQTMGENVRINLGQDPFKFDILSFVKRRKQEMTEAVLSSSIPRDLASSLATRPTLVTQPPPTPAYKVNAPINTVDAEYEDPLLRTALQNLIASYLSHKGYSDTVRAFRAQREVERRDWDELLTASTGSASGSHANGVGNGETKDLDTPKKSGKAVKRKSTKSASSKTVLKSALRTTLVRTGENEDEDETTTTPPTGTDQEMEISRPASTAPLSANPSLNDVEMSSAPINLPGVEGASAPPGKIIQATTLTGLRRRSLDIEEKELLDSKRRDIVCTAIRRGDIDKALPELYTNYPAVCEAKKGLLLFKLRCQKFVELILASNGGGSDSSGESPDGDVDMDDEEEDDREEAEIASALILSRNGSGPKRQTSTAVPTMEEVLSYGAYLNELYSAPSTLPAQRVNDLQLIFSLVAYNDPQRMGGDIGAICSQEARDQLAEDVNSAMLESQGRPSRPLLETLYRQAYAVRTVLGDACADGRAALVGDVIDS